MAISIWLNLIVVFIATIIGAKQYRFIKQKFNLLFIYVCSSAITQLTVDLLILGGFKNNLPLLHIYLLIEFLLLSFFYRSQIGDFLNKKWFYAISALFVIYSLINSFFIQNFFVYPNIPRAIEALILILYSLIYFKKVLIETKVLNLMNDSMIWVNLGVLLYFSGNLFYHVLFNLTLNYSRDFAKMIGIYFTLLNLLYYILIAIGFWKAGKEVEIANK